MKDKGNNIYRILDSCRCWRVPHDILECLAVYIAGINNHSRIFLALKRAQGRLIIINFGLQRKHLNLLTILNM